MSLFHERSGKFSPEKTIALVGSVLPAVALAAWAIGGDLGGRPVSAAIHFTGLWAIRLLFISLAVTPARRIFHWPKLVLARRTLGVAALAYAALHLGLFVMDQGWNVQAAAREIVLRFYLTIGAVAVALLLALGGTSFDRVIRRMGAKRWNALHASVYGIAILASIHFFIQSKLDVTQAVMMTGFLIWLFGYRIWHRATNAVAPRDLLVLAVASAVLTGLVEMAWYGTLTGISPWLVAQANFQPQLGISPALWVLAAGLAVALAALLRLRLVPPAKLAKVRVPARP
ncbi:sulfite oxidase heme-binding subunit YedZ [Azorhizobium doebereinerae]|uniref:sulfite oxidase heme-binding subunit YedZ n=1 Tax=Azorhizobium doebereinerae TaxID=281091 RepID=UPI000404B2A8|nr:ferric reductase-like transmembrane domain-containing protein [Azorhizobium doebereinerae]